MMSRRSMASAFALRGLTDTAVIAHRTLTRDPFGGSTESWVNSAPFPARLEGRTAIPIETPGVAAQVNAVQEYTLWVAPSLVVSPVDRVHTLGRVFEVTGSLVVDDVSVYGALPLREIV